MAKAFSIYWKKVDTGDGDYTMDHTASVLLLNAKGEFSGTIAYGESADTAIAKLKRLAAREADKCPVMTPDRLYFTVPARSRPTASLPRSKPAFEDEGLPIAVLEVDEDRDIHEVSLYADGDVDAVESAAEGHPCRPFRCRGRSSAKRLPDIDWVARSLEGLKPVRAGRFFVHGAHDRRKRHSGELAIEIEAGLAFGTGHHGTTAGCLEMLERVVRREHPAQCARPRHRQRRAGHRRRQARAYSGAGDRHRSDRRQGRRRQCPAQPRQGAGRNGDGDRLSPSDLCGARALRPHRRQHTGAAADAAGAANGQAYQRSAARSCCPASSTASATR